VKDRKNTCALRFSKSYFNEKNKTCCPSRMLNVRVGHGNKGGMNQ